MQAGHILLENGAEIFRVEETIDRICHYYGIESGNAFVLSNGIFITSGNEREEIFGKGPAYPGERSPSKPGGRGEPAVQGDRGGAVYHRRSEGTAG